MAIMDAKGRVRPGYFEKVFDEETGTTFEPVSGNGVRMTMKAVGKEVDDVNDEFVAAGPILDAKMLAMKAKMAGVVKQRMPFSEFVLTLPRGRGRR